jgi:hypothetical protein
VSRLWNPFWFAPAKPCMINSYRRNGDDGNF